MSSDDKSGFQLQVVPVTPLQQNAMIFWSVETRNAILLDPGGDVDRLMEEIEKLQVKVVAIWLTHGHIDHAGGAAEARRRLDVEIIGPHKDDQFLLDELKPGTYGIAEAESFTPDRYLDDGDTVELDGVRFQLLHCPGHSPGSVVFFQPELSFAFVGDVLFNGSIGRTDLPGGNHQQLIDSITQKLWPLGTKIQFMPGHGPGSTFEQERASNGFVADSVLGQQ
jgi:glyoxylase-like metal-dependent hydrolase (beta-lactamase superfamily II)